MYAIRSYYETNHLWSSKWTTLSSLLVVCVTSQLPAQTTDDDASAEDVYELSPFEVNTSESMGYLATSSLAGSRLKTELRDVSAAISVVTPEFLSDTGATNLEDLP